MKKKYNYIFFIILILIFLSYKFCQQNQDKIFIFQAELSFKKNNFIKAQNYYEKAFELGYKDYKHREKYVNSIINSPLTLDSQYKIIKFLEYPIDDVAKFKAEYFLKNIKREIARKYSNNYISNAVYNQKIIRWGNVPITYTFSEENNLPTYFKDEIQAAFNEWANKLNIQNMFKYIEDKNANIIIKFEDNMPNETEDTKYIVAYTVPFINMDILERMEITFYLKNPNQELFTNTQVYNTALHEIGHALGFMGHSNNKNNIMYYTKDSTDYNTNSRQELSEADLNTLKLLYKTNPQICNTKKSSSEYIPYIVLGAENDIITEKIKEAKTYIQNAPHLSSGYVDLAEAYVSIKDYKKAIKNLKQALLLADTEEIKAMIYYNLAVVNFHADDYQIALEYLKKSIEISSSNEKLFLMAEIYLRDGNTNKATKIYEDLLNKNPNNIEYVISLTNIYVIEKNFFKARKILKKYFKLNPEEKHNKRFKPYGVLKIGI